MSQTLDKETRDILRDYLREIRSLPNEAAKRARFYALITELFPRSRAVSDYARGIEKLIRVRTTELRDNRGYADAYYGNAIIEFEKSLKATLTEAERQLKEYVAGLWPKPEENPRSLIAIASDGVHWRSYRPVIPAESPSPPAPEQVRLDLLREFRVSEEGLGDFWLWLTRLLFRPQQVEPTAGKLTESTSPAKDVESDIEISELENLFLRHTYLSSIARFSIWASLSQGKTRDSLRQVAQDVLNGNFFRARKLANLVEDDFFHWVRHSHAESVLASSWERILSHFLDYDLAQINKDVLKGVYQQLIDPKDRHDLGEYYTPDWLCERMVMELLPTQGFKAVLDPSCGSGSFLRACIAHYIEHNPSMEERERLSKIIAHVKGIDIHPVAVTIARATYVLALGPLIRRAPKPIQIPVYLADSLFLPREVESNLIEQLSGIEITYGGRKDQRRFVVPDMLIHSRICSTMLSRLAPQLLKSMRSPAKIRELQCPRTWHTLFRTY